MEHIMLEKKYDEITLKIFDTRGEMGMVAAAEAIVCIKNLLATKEEINCVFAAAPSQNDFLTSLVSSEEIQWNRINAYHMDEYVGFEMGDPRSFTGFLDQIIFDKVPFKTISRINGLEDPTVECARYTDLIKNNPIDITFMGIGENGHIAFNDPSVADFNDPQVIKKVLLEESCRVQQVNDGCFKTIDDVPQYALTLTIPTLVSSKHIFCIVPTINKADAVKATLTGDINATCPASILRNTPEVKMYVDSASASKL